MQGNNGLSRARLRKILRDARPPAPIEPVNITLAAGANPDEAIDVQGMNITPSTNMVVVPDQAVAPATAALDTKTITPSTQDGLGTIATTWDFTNIPGATANLYRIYLTGPWGERVFVGTIGSA